MRKKEFFAHSENPQGEKHNLEDHLRRTAALAQSFSPKQEFERLFHLAGILHDIGKYQANFQKYLECGKPKTPHAGIGGFIARTVARKHIPLPFVIKGHHAGLPDKEELASALELIADDSDGITEVERQFRQEFSDFGTTLNEAKPVDIKDKLLIECLTRLMFSALTDADWLDTENHFKRELSSTRTSQPLNHDAVIATFERSFTELQTGGKIDQLRTEARNSVAGKFASPLGFFALQLPTGLGKTLTSVYWSLLHARHHGLKRVIIVLPYINIIDQTAKILKEIFGEDTVLEHHSGIVEEDQKNDSYDESAIGDDKDLAKRLACENWDAPIIVTTSVQFFESLFSNRPFKCRKNHNVAESVVIFDEVQSLPKHYAEPIIVLLKNLNQLARTSFLFCTATQPAFARRESFDGIESIQPLIENPEGYFNATQRVNYILLNKLKEVSLDRVITSLSKETKSFLVIANTKLVTRNIFQRVSAFKGYDHFYHLSTSMCPHHRMDTIKSIISDLEPKSRKRIAVVSTQLVEAGVDLDFPCVYRAIAPLDAVIQAAGRCNRNGRLKKGRVVLFNLKDHKMPDRMYEAAANLAMRMISDNPSILHEATSFEKYYESLSLFVDTDRYQITENRKNGNFKTVAENFRLIDSPTTSLFIRSYSDESERLLKEIETSPFITREHLRKLQQFSVQVYPQFLTKYSNQIERFKDTIYIWHGSYDSNVGLSPEDINTVF
jgi:CRISPR-associated endonuclease/helicase Cas3